MSSSTIDAVGNIHSGTTGRFTGKALEEGDLEGLELLPSVSLVDACLSATDRDRFNDAALSDVDDAIENANRRGDFDTADRLGRQFGLICARRAADLVTSLWPGAEKLVIETGTHSYARIHAVTPIGRVRADNGARSPIDSNALSAINEEVRYLPSMLKSECMKQGAGGLHTVDLALARGIIAADLDALDTD